MKIIANSTSAKPIGPPYQATPALITVADEDPDADVIVMRSASAPTPDDVRRNGTNIKALQEQLQGATADTPIDLSTYYATVKPFAVTSSTTVTKRAYVCLPDNSAFSYVAADFAQPAANGTASVDVLDASGFTVSNYNSGTDSGGVFIEGSGYHHVTAITGNTLSVTFTGLPGGAVTTLL